MIIKFVAFNMPFCLFISHLMIRWAVCGNIGNC